MSRASKAAASSLLAVALLVAGSTPRPLLAADPTPSPGPSATPSGSGDGQEAGQEGPLFEPPSCGSAQPGLIPLPDGGTINVAIVGAEAGSPSDLLLTQPDQATLLADATDNLGQARLVDDFGAGAQLEFAIYTSAFGTTRTSTGQYAKVLEGVPGVWLICFEDGADSDFDDLVIRVGNMACGSESMIETPTAGPVHVRYDPHFVWPSTDPAYVQKAAVIAEAIRARAVVARERYRALHDAFGLTDAVPSDTAIEIACHPTAAVFLGDLGPVFTESEGLIKISGGVAYAWMKSLIGDNPPTSPPAAGTAWADSVDHELYHTLQYRALDPLDPLVFAFRYKTGNYANFESTATLAQDLFIDFDDRRRDQVTDAAFLAKVGKFLKDHTSLIYDDYDHKDPDPIYAAAGFFEYLAERYGDAGITNLETRAAEFARRIVVGPQQLKAIGAAIGESEIDAIDALRDFYIALYARFASNAETLDPDYRILDEIVGHGQPIAWGPPDDDKSWGSLVSLPTVAPPNNRQNLLPTTAVVYELPVAGGTSQIRVTIADESPPGETANDALRLAFMPKTGSAGAEAIVDEWMQVVTGPASGTSQVYTIPAAGLSQIGIIAVAGRSTADFTITIDALTGPVTLSIDDITGAYAGHNIPVYVHPAVEGFGTRKQPKQAFTATIDGVAATVVSIHDLGSKQKIIVHPLTTLAAGTHTLAVTYESGGLTATDSDSFEVVSGGGPPAITIEPLILGGAGQAGRPIEIRSVLTDETLGVTGGTVTATVTDPNGVARTFPLLDEGSEFDALYQDGAYGAAVAGTQVPGTYTVRVDATGVDGGAPYAVSSTTTISLGPIVDGDADAVADSVELQLGLDPVNPADGETDLDVDGAGTASELAAGSDPLRADTDEAGEADGSELAAGRDPLNATDDVALPQALIGAVAQDGRTVAVTVVASDAATPIHVYRFGDSGTTDLSLQPGAGETFTDGPLATGDYHYDAVAETAGGATSVRVSSSTVTARDDATSPYARLLVNAGATLARDPALSVRFVDRSETPTEMRFAETEDDLAAAPWVPYQVESTFSLAATAGGHRVLAELRDAMGNASGPIEGSIVLDLSSPTSTVGSIPAVTYSPTINVPYTASDDYALGGVELYVRYRPTATASWTPWLRATMGMSSPIFYTFNNGTGFYEFATVAADAAGNREPLPASGDAAIRYGGEVVSDDTGTAFQGDADARTGLDGQIYAVWTDNRNSASVSDIYFAKRNASGETWGPNERVDDAAVAANSGAIAVDTAGNAYVVWVDARAGDKDVWFSKRSAATGTWSPSVRVNDVAGAIQDQPAIAVSPTGEAIAVWNDHRNNKRAIYSARLPAGATTWSANVKVSSDATNTKLWPDVAIGADGVAYATWSHQKNAKWYVWFASLPSGGTTWTSNVQLSDSTRSQSLSRIGVDTAGNLLVVYLDGGSAVWAKRRPAGSSSWSAPTTISNLPSVPRPPTLGVRPDGSGYAVWDDSSDRLYGARYNPTNQTWAAQQQITSSTNHVNPVVGLIPGTAVIVVQDLASVSYDVRAYTQVVP